MPSAASRIPTRSAVSSNRTMNDGGSLLRRKAFVAAHRALGSAESTKRYPPGRAVEHERQSEHDVVDRGVHDRREEQQRDDEAPEVELAPIGDGMIGVGAVAGTVYAVEQQLVAGFDEGMHGLLSIAELPVHSAAASLVAVTSRLPASAT